MPRTTLARSERRFWSKVQVGPECWTWRGWKTRTGYGGACLMGRQIEAHRAMWTVFYGPIPEGICVLHRCDNPSCLRPSHLFLGTHRENMGDMMAKGRGPIGERAFGCKLSREKVEEILRLRGSMTHQAIADRYSMGRVQITRIMNGTRWRHVKREEPCR